MLLLSFLARYSLQYSKLSDTRSVLCRFQVSMLMYALLHRRRKASALVQAGLYAFLHLLHYGFIFHFCLVEIMYGLVKFDTFKFIIQKPEGKN